MKIIIFLFIILSTVRLTADTVIPPGNVSGTWTAVNSPYLIEGEITIPDGETLVINPNVLVEFQGHYKFHVQGRLLAIGTNSENIVFTIDDTTGFHDINLQEGAWQGIRFNNTPATNDSSKIIYCRIEYGKANGFELPCSGSGGAIYVENFSKLLIRNSEISNNIAMLGGGIAFDESNGVKIENTLISNNEGWSGGGGIHIYQSNPILDEVILQENYAGSGGGIACWYSSSPMITNSSFINNGSTVHGGGIYCKFGSSPSLIDVVFQENTSSYGAAMNFNDESNPTIVRALITNNHAGFSGAFSCGNDSSPAIINSTISNNTADYSGGVSYIYDSNPVFVNSIIWSNTPEAFYISDWNQYYNLLFFAYCDIENGQESIVNPEFADVVWAEGNIDEDPIFADPVNNDFTLSHNSPCIDVGTDYFSINAWTYVDLDPDEYFGAAPDMGVFEYEGTSVHEEQIVNAKTSNLTNYPNPFNPSTTISFNIDADVSEETELIIYNLRGQKIRHYSNLNNQSSIVWEGTDQTNKPVSSGVYLYKLKTDKYILTNKMLLMK